MPLVSVIVPARDASGTLGRTLAALAGQELEGDYEVIVVDDGSRDATAEVARAAPGPVTVLSQPAAGPAAARNRGVRHARAALLAFCDADVFPTPRWLSAGVSALGSADLVQGRVLPDPQARLGPFDRTLWITKHVGLFETANLFATRQAFDRAGGFEQWLEPRRGKALAEDVWFGYRALRAGARVSFCPESLAHHAVFPRAWPAYVAERTRLEYFPAMARQMPEMRREFFYLRAFLTPRSARFDLAWAALALAALGRAKSPLVLALPYLRELRRHSMRVRPEGPRALAVAGADAAADLVGLASLLWGSLRFRSPVL
jgi:glycosyltransferase involved in cell wall biosynthesis